VVVRLRKPKAKRKRRMREERLRFRSPKQLKIIEVAVILPKFRVSSKNEPN
jgi:hypothetical protein